MVAKRFRVVICRGPSCGDKRGSASLHEAMSRALRQRGLLDRVELDRGACFGRCRVGPNFLVEEIAEVEQRFAFATFPTPRDGTAAMYNRVAASDIDEIIEQHILRGRIVGRLVIDPGSEEDEEPPSSKPAGDSDGK